MVKSGSETVLDRSSSYKHGSRSGSGSDATASKQFKSGNIADMYKKQVPQGPDHDDSDSEKDDMSLEKLLKDVEFLGASTMPWKERKKLENQKVVNMGGKAVKKHRTPLSVAMPAMKNQKKREEKKKEEDLILGRFTKRIAKDNDKVNKRRPEDRVLKATPGYFHRGVLDVKQLLAPAPPKSDDSSYKMGNGKRKGKGKGKGNKGKRKGGRKGRK